MNASQEITRPNRPEWIGLSALVDGELHDPDQVLAELDRPGAVEELRDLVRARALFTPDVGIERLSHEASSELWQRIHREEIHREEVRRVEGRRLRAAAWAVAAMLVVVLGAGLWFGTIFSHSTSETEPSPVVRAQLDEAPPADRVLRLGPQDRWIPTPPQEIPQ